MRLAYTAPAFHGSSLLLPQRPALAKELASLEAALSGVRLVGPNPLGLQLRLAPDRRA